MSLHTWPFARHVEGRRLDALTDAILNFAHTRTCVGVRRHTRVPANGGMANVGDGWRERTTEWDATQWVSKWIVCCRLPRHRLLTTHSVVRAELRGRATASSACRN